MPTVPKPQQPSNTLEYSYSQGGAPNGANISALEQKVEQLQREQAKVQDLLGSLSFSLRSFNNLNQFLALIPLVVSRVTDADAATLVLFRNNGQASLEHLYCHEGQWCHNIRHTLELAIRQVNARDNPSTPSLGEQLEQRFKQLFDQDYFWFSTAILVRNVEPHERGRLYLFSRQHDYRWTETRQKLAQLVADQTAVAIENDELTSQVRRQERLSRELEIGAEIQARLFPNRCPHIDGVELAATCKTANQVGGDYYDFIPMNLQASTKQQYGFPATSWSLVIGDVMGKGVPAGLIMTMTRGVLRNDIINQHTPAQILQNLNQVMFADLENSNRFVTLFYSEYEPRSRTLRFSNAAHHPPLLWRAASDTIERLDTDGMLIGLDFNTIYQEDQVQLYAGDTIIFYTDGFTDAANPIGERFGETKLIQAFRSACHTCINPQMILEQLFDAVQTFVGAPSQKNQDDMTLIVLRTKQHYPNALFSDNPRHRVG